MIKNERQYHITRTQLERFATALAELRERVGPAPSDTRSWFELAAVEAQVSELQSELDDYEALRANPSAVGRLESLRDLPRLLIRSRIAQGLTQKDLADRLGMPEQQVQRYEATDWATASLSRLINVAEILDVDLTTDSGQTGDNIDVVDLKRRLRQAGLDATFIDQRLVPVGQGGTAAVLDLASRVQRIYGWVPSQLTSSEPLDFDVPAAAGFKLPKAAAEPRTRAYTVYSHYIALLALQVTPERASARIPTTPAEFRKVLFDRGGTLTFGAILDLVWDSGVPVVPLADAGAFHAVLWRINGRNVVALKQQTRTTSRWAFDLLHEIHHALEQPAATEYAVLEDGQDPEADAEVMANSFAGDVLLDGRAEELTEQCVSEARGKVEYLKTAVPRVADRNDVELAHLANYVAYRLSLQGINWWGTAANLQAPSDGDPWLIARDRFLREADLRLINPLDRDILIQALTG